MHTGRIDFAANNAGVANPNTKTTDMTVEMFDRVSAVNEKGVSVSEHLDYFWRQH